MSKKEGRSGSLPRIPVTAIVLTLNEEENLSHCLGSLDSFDEIVVLDSYSRDRTEAVAREYGVTFLQNSFAGFGGQRNWALDHIRLRNEWVLFLDADERMTPELADEINHRVRNAAAGTGAFRLKRRFYFWGRWLKYSSLYPTWVVRLVHKDRVRYANRGHAETQEVKGAIKDLTNDLVDENRKGIDDWFARQNGYSTRDALFELVEQQKKLNLRDLVSSEPLARRAALKRISYRMPARELVYFAYSYLWKRGFLDGRDGLMFCRMRAAYQGMIVAKKHDLIRKGIPVDGQGSEGEQ